jgi:hypothetical protein
MQYMTGKKSILRRSLLRLGRLAGVSTFAALLGFVRQGAAEPPTTVQSATAAQPAGLAERPQKQAPAGAVPQKQSPVGAVPQQQAPAGAVPQKQAPVGATGQAQQPIK